MGLLKGNYKNGFDKRGSMGETRAGYHAKMTAEQAASFDTYSLSNATILAMAASARGCTCQAYSDWYTYRRWAAQGKQVKQGEHGTHIPIIVCVPPDDENKKQAYQLRRTSVVFCRCQVK